MANERTVLITGIGKGIGKALAEKFLAEGWQVIGTVLGSEAPSAERLTVLPLDLASPESIASCVAAVGALGIPLDVVINNAGILADEDDTELQTEKLRRTLEVNLIGTTHLTERLLPLVRDGGHIVNISSTAGSLELAGSGTSHYPLHYPAYKISKAALNMYTRTLALRLRDRTIAVSSAHPGWVRTDMGGPEAEVSPEEAAKRLYAVASGHPETGQFWFGSEKLPW